MRPKFPDGAWRLELAQHLLLDLPGRSWTVGYARGLANTDASPATALGPRRLCIAGRLHSRSSHCSEVVEWDAERTSARDHAAVVAGEEDGLSPGAKELDRRQV